MTQIAPLRSKASIQRLPSPHIDTHIKELKPSRLTRDRYGGLFDEFAEHELGVFQATQALLPATKLVPEFPPVAGEFAQLGGLLWSH
jgi:hypothetical protein